MRLRKSVTAPARYEDDEVNERQTRDCTKPKHPQLLKQQIVPFNPDQHPAAFPSLPLARLTEPICSSTSPQSKEDANTTISGWSSTSSQKDTDISRRINVATDCDTVMKENGMPNTRNDRNDHLSTSRNSAMDEEKLESMTEITKDPYTISWSLLDLATRFRIFHSLLLHYRLDVAGHLLKLNNAEMLEMYKAIHMRERYPASTQEIWEYVATRSSDSVTYLDPAVSKYYMDYLVYAGNHEYTFEQQLRNGKKYLQQCCLSTDHIGNWISDPHGSGYFVEASSYPMSTEDLEGTPVTIEPFDNYLYQTYNLLLKDDHEASTGSDRSTTLSVRNARSTHTKKQDRLVKRTTATVFELSYNDLAKAAAPLKHRPPPLVLKYRKNLLPSAVTTKTNTIPTQSIVQFGSWQTQSPTLLTGLLDATNMNTLSEDSGNPNTVNPNHQRLKLANFTDVQDHSGTPHSKATSLMGPLNCLEDHTQKQACNKQFELPSSSFGSLSSRLTLRIDNDGLASVIDCSTSELCTSPLYAASADASLNQSATQHESHGNIKNPISKSRQFGRACSGVQHKAPHGSAYLHDEAADKQEQALLPQLHTQMSSFTQKLLHSSSDQLSSTNESRKGDSSSESTISHAETDSESSNIEYARNNPLGQKVDDSLRALDGSSSKVPPTSDVMTKTKIADYQTLQNEQSHEQHDSKASHNNEASGADASDSNTHTTGMTSTWAPRHSSSVTITKASLSKTDNISPSFSPTLVRGRRNASRAIATLDTNTGRVTLNTGRSITITSPALAASMPTPSKAQGTLTNWVQTSLPQNNPNLITPNPSRVFSPPTTPKAKKIATPKPRKKKTEAKASQNKAMRTVKAPMTMIKPMMQNDTAEDREHGAKERAILKDKTNLTSKAVKESSNNPDTK